MSLLPTISSQLIRTGKLGLKSPFPFLNFDLGRSATRFVEWFELWVEAGCVLCGFDEDPANVPVPLPSYVPVECMVR